MKFTLRKICSSGKTNKKLSAKHLKHTFNEISLWPGVICAMSWKLLLRTTCQWQSPFLPDSGLGKAFGHSSLFAVYTATAVHLRSRHFSQCN